MWRLIEGLLSHTVLQCSNMHFTHLHLHLYRLHAGFIVIIIIIMDSVAMVT